MIRLALNATPLLSPLTGIGQYIYQLAKGLQGFPDLHIDFFYSTGWSKHLREKPLQNVNTLKSLLKRIVPCSYSIKRNIDQYRFNKGIKFNQISLYHEPNFLPLQFDGPTVLTVHDLSWIRFPETHPPQRVQAMNRYFEPGLRRADLVLTDSEFVKRELIDVFGIAPDLIKPVPLGVEPLFHPRSVAETLSVLTRHNLSHGRYLISVGTLEPRKNVQATLSAYMHLSPTIRKNFPLVLVGMNGWHMSSLEKQMAPLIRAGEVRQIGYLPREDLAAIIAGALTMIYPSIYEGFGLPPLEAMASGVPVITSNVSSLPEVVGETGLLVDPRDIDALATSIETLVTAPDIRSDLSQKAFTRSLMFSWENCVKQTMKAYDQVMGL